jgi:hypothetical protein
VVGASDMKLISKDITSSKSNEKYNLRKN